MEGEREAGSLIVAGLMHERKRDLSCRVLSDTATFEDAVISYFYL